MDDLIQDNGKEESPVKPLLQITLLKKNKASSQLSLREKSKRNKPVLQVEEGSELEKQLNMIRLTTEDLAVAQSLKPSIESHIEEIVSSFYKNMENVPELMRIIEENSSVERLKKTLRIHVIDMFSGVIDQDFIDKRIRIAYAHVKVGLTQKWYIASFQDMLVKILHIIEKTFNKASDRMLAITTVTKLLNLEQQLVLEAYDNEIERMRETEHQRKEKLRSSIGKTANELAALTEQTSASIEEITAQVEEIANQSRLGTEMADRAEKNAENGKVQLDSLHDTFHRVQESTMKISKDIESLEKTSSQIEDIVEIVKSVAEQTNLLALNASIEAARAGEHGRGFAVVADEVRKLAEQTSQSVTRVTELINQTNEQIRVSAESIKDVDMYMSEGNEKMKDTDKAFEEIVTVMRETKQRNESVEQELEGFKEVINEIANAASTISVSAEELNQTMEKI
mgnify:CR=1 FL=1